MGRKENEHQEPSSGPNSCKYHSRSAAYKQNNKAQEENTKEKFKNNSK
ncbi:hypothetical protein [Candidatus Clostridium stratigraminis]|uniref:Uncharacterized protein n=1 Tax=Candidatus Clostridium stratigraminis TaxID=3381661 RepID=A0ABW8T3G8_9CLOT